MTYYHQDLVVYDNGIEIPVTPITNRIPVTIRQDVPHLDLILNRISSCAMLINLIALHVERLLITRLSARAMYRKHTILLNPYTKSFSPYYRGKKKYRIFGGVTDLTPGGVFAHECGHAAIEQCPQLLTEFRVIRRHHKKSITGYASKYLEEDVAECFRLYVTNPLQLKAIDLIRYNVMELYAKRFKL